METEREAGVRLRERELHLVAVAPGIVHSGDGFDGEVAQAADVLERLDDLALLELELRRVGEGLPLAAAALAGVAARGGHTRRRRLDDLEEPCLGMPLSAARHLRPHPVAGHRSAHEDDEVVVAGKTLPTVGQGVDAQVEDVAGSRRHGRSVDAFA